MIEYKDIKKYGKDILITLSTGIRKPILEIVDEMTNNVKNYFPSSVANIHKRIIYEINSGFYDSSLCLALKQIETIKAIDNLDLYYNRPPSELI